MRNLLKFLALPLGLSAALTLGSFRPASAVNLDDFYGPNYEYWPALSTTDNDFSGDTDFPDFNSRRRNGVFSTTTYPAVVGPPANYARNAYPGVFGPDYDGFYEINAYPAIVGPDSDYFLL